MEEKILFQVTKIDESSSVKIHTETEEDVFAVALAIHQTLTENKVIRDMAEALALMALTDKDFNKEVKSKTIKLPDFDKILKDN